MTCSDCGHEVTRPRPDRVDKGSSVREPGEVLCLGCSAHRTKMVRELDALPSRLDQIQALRLKTGFHRPRHALSNR